MLEKFSREDEEQIYKWAKKIKRRVALSIAALDATKLEYDKAEIIRMIIIQECDLEVPHA